MISPNSTELILTIDMQLISPNSTQLIIIKNTGPILSNDTELIQFNNMGLIAPDNPQLIQTSNRGLISLNSNEPIPQGYTKLKTLDEIQPRNIDLKRFVLLLEHGGLHGTHQKQQAVSPAHRQPATKQYNKFVIHPTLCPDDVVMLM